MIKNWKKYACFFLCGMLLIGSLFMAPEQVQAKAKWPSGPSVASPNAIVMEASTGTVLYEKNADEKRYPASITKIMTTLLAIENSSMDEVVTFSADAVYKNEGDTSHIWRDVDEKMTMEQCLYAVMLESANECSYAVAEHVAGGVYSDFIKMMNARAKELGCTNTHFNNCNGLPDEKHVTTCRDMALISRAAIQNSEFRKIAGSVRYTIPKTNKHKEETPLNNHHQMISVARTSKNLYEYCIGGKTGWTSDAGNTLVTFAEKDGMTLICVVMKAQQGEQYTDTRALFDYCFEHFKLFNVSKNESRYETGITNQVSLFTSGEAFVELDKEAQIVLPASASFEDTTTEVSQEGVTDQILGTLVYSYDGRQVGTCQIRTTGVTVEPYQFGESTISKSSEKKNVIKTTKKEKKPEKSTEGGRKKIVIAIAAVAGAIVILLVIWYLYNNVYRIWRRRRRHDKRYKTIKNNRKWNRRGGRRSRR